MQEQLERMLLCYGFSKEEYEQSREHRETTNRTAMQLFALCAIFFSMLLILIYRHLVADIAFALVIVGGVVTLFVNRSSAKASYPACLVWFRIYSFTIVAGAIVFDTWFCPTDRSVITIVLLAGIPAVLVGQVITTIVLNELLAMALVVCAGLFKDVNLAYEDTLSVMVFSVLGVLIHYFIGSARIRHALTLIKQQEYERALELVRESFSVRTWIYDVSGRRVIERTSDAFGQETERIVVNVPDSLIAGNQIIAESEEAYRRLYRDIHEGKERTEAEIGYLNTDGTVRWERVKYYVFLDADKQPERAVACAIDLTRERTLQKEKEEAENRLSMAFSEDRVKGVLMGRIVMDVSGNKILKMDDRLVELYGIDPAHGGEEETILYFYHTVGKQIFDEAQRRQWEKIFNINYLLSQHRFYRDDHECGRIYRHQGMAYALLEHIHLQNDPITGHLTAVVSVYDVSEIPDPDISAHN